MQPPQPCNCLGKTTEALNRFPDLSTSDNYRIPLDEVLSIGTDLVDRWELLHGCPVNTHLDAPMVQTMIDATIKTLTLYEAAVESILGGWGKETNGGGIGMCLDRDPLLSVSVSQCINWGLDHSNPSSGHNGGTSDTKPAVVVTEVPVSFGVMQLDSQEKTMVARETLRHAATRLGEMLHDIEEDMGANPSERNEQAEVRQLTSRLLQILGRINSHSE
ncbi:Transcription factor [Penicillium cf. griseofulvum]|nr:Transcription factor [Penicillium cf. griseofulvum]KAJ5447727.1 Transcription factor [Penicillium cf. griseofulvum]